MKFACRKYYELRRKDLRARRASKVDYREGSLLDLPGGRSRLWRQPTEKRHLAAEETMMLTVKENHQASLEHKGKGKEENGEDAVTIEHHGRGECVYVRKKGEGSQ